jgi:sporulation integral membrane protein YtvI
LSKYFSKRLFIILLILAIIIAAALIILPVSLPLLIAFFTALFLEPAVKMLQQQVKLKRNIAVLITFLLFLCLIGVSGYFIVTKVITEAINLIENAPQLIIEVSNKWYEIQEDFDTSLRGFPPEFVNEINNQANTFFNKTRTQLLELDYIGYITTIVTDIPNYLVSFIVYLIALFLFLLEMPLLKERTFVHLKTKTADKVQFMASRMSYVVFGFFKAQFLVSIIIFIVALIGLFLIEPEVALVMSFIIWIIDFIPIVGSITILGPWAVYSFIIGDIAVGTKLSILAFILLTIRRTVEPKVMGQQIGLSPLSTLISMYIGLKLLGILGFVVGPLLLIIFNSAREAGIIKLNFKI